MNEAQQATAENIIPLPADRPTKAAPKTAPARFKVREFNNASGSRSWHVTGRKRDGTRIRENFADVQAAQCRQIELETEYLKGHAETTVQATTLPGEKLRLAELAFIKLADDWEQILDAVEYWQSHGKHLAVAESPRIDDAIDKYLEWLAASPFRDATKRHWKTRMTVFKNSVANVRVADADADFIEKFLAGRGTSAIGKDTDRRAVSRFFSWCIEKKWSKTNPARKQTRTRKPESQPPSVLTVKQCRALLKASERSGLAAYTAICLFGGIRPFEASRLKWESVNLKDREIRLESTQTKTRKARVISICDTLAVWLEAYKGQDFFPANWRKKFDAVKQAAKIKDWPADVMRHTAASHYFRKTGSYGQTAEQFGNSEAIIKAHYQGRVSTDDTKKFYALLPKKGGRK
jgi:integrase